MADATQGDTDVQYLGLLVPALIALIAGLLIQSFIVGVNVSDWWKGRSVTAVDHIVTGLGFSRMCVQCANTLYMIVVTLFQGNLNSYIILIIINGIYDLFTYANIWLTSLLSIVLCLKISNLHSRLFLYLRGVIIQRTGSLIVASGLLSIFNSLIPLPIVITEVTKGGADNITTANPFMDCIYINSIYNYTIGSFFPLLFYCISSVLLITTLYHHTTKMKMSSNLSINLETYYSAMRFVSVTLMYNTLYFIGHIVCIFYYYVHCVFLLWLYFVLDLLPVLHSSYIIYRTAKLRSKMSKVFENVIGFLLQRKDTEVRENIEVVAL